MEEKLRIVRIPYFEIRLQRSIRLAKCERVPQLMLVAGPNGAGKSTLLNTLRTASGHQHIIYLGPHRAMRRQTVQQRHLLSTHFSLEEILARPDIPHFEGIQVVTGLRDPWSYDDSANYLKHTLCQVEVDRSQAIAARYDLFGEIPRGSLVDPWKPLRELTNNLLPHLTFAKIDATNRDHIRCLWNVHDKDLVVDLDDLSSGEKSIIQMFYPLIEHEIKALLGQIQGSDTQEARPEICLLIDEPELHLHPNSQLKVLDYLRVLTTGSNTQVILATHSPAMVEYASFEELFLLRPPELVRQEENQLIQVADDDERLRFLREAFGTTSNLTALQPIVIVESVTEKEAVKVMPDRKLYRALHPGFDSVTLISGGGKGQCMALLEALDSALNSFSSQLQAIALLDRDYTQEQKDARIRLLPVGMVENFLLDPDSIWEAIQSVIERTGLSTVDDIAQALDKIMDELEEEEIQRRAISMLGLAYFRPESPLSDIPVQLSTFITKLGDRYSIDNVNTTAYHARTQVDRLRATRRRREEFHGKAVLKAFYGHYLHSTGLQKGIFTFETARHARRRRAVVQFFDNLFNSLNQDNPDAPI